MRNKKLLFSSVIAFAGIIIYFLTIPTVDEATLVDLTVKAGNKDALENIYFNGRLSDYSSFHISEEGVETPKGLSYLEQQDVPNDPILAQIQKDYPNFINRIIYNNAAWGYKIINSTDYLVGGYIEFDVNNKYWDTSTLQLKIFNKEGGTLKEEEVKREDYPEEGRTEILGLYEAYPVIKILYSTSVHSGIDISKDTSVQTVGEYNVETKTYSEREILSEDGYFYRYNTQSSAASNNELQLVEHIEYENKGSEIGEQALYLYNFKDDVMTLIDLQNAYPIIGQTDQLYALENIGEEMVLKHYDQKGEEVLAEVILDLQIPLSPTGEYPPVMRIIDNELYLVQSTTAEYSDWVSAGVSPTPLQVFDIETGKSLLIGEFNFDTKNEVNAREGVIEEIGTASDL